MEGPRYEFIQMSFFSKQLDQVNDPELLNTVEEELTQNPEAGSLLKGGIRKVRIASRSEGRGKRGSFRVWYYFRIGDHFLLLYLLDKRDAENISKKQEDALVAALKKALDEA